MKTECIFGAITAHNSFSSPILMDSLCAVLGLQGYGVWTTLQPGLWHHSAMCHCCGCGWREAQGIAKPHGPAGVPGWHHVPLSSAGMVLAKLHVLQTRWYPGLAFGFKHTVKEENALHIFFSKEILLQKASHERWRWQGEGGVFYHSFLSWDQGIAVLPFSPWGTFCHFPGALWRKGPKQQQDKVGAPDTLQGMVNPVEVKGSLLPCPWDL